MYRFSCTNIWLSYLPYYINFPLLGGERQYRIAYGTIVTVIDYYLHRMYHIKEMDLTVVYFRAR